MHGKGRFIVPDEAKDFIIPLLEMVEEYEGIIYLAFGIPDGGFHQEFVQSFKDAEIAFQNCGRGRNIYFSHGIRDPETKKPGLKEAVVALCGYWVDIDFKDTDEQDVRQKMEEFPLKPSAIIQTGGGLHLHWLFREPESADEPEEHEAVLHGLVDYFGGDHATAHIGALLRVPGFINLPNQKKRESGRIATPVITEELNEQRYNPADFDQYARDYVTLPATLTTAESDIELKNLPKRFLRIIQEEPGSPLAKVWRGEWNDPRDNKRSGHDAALTYQLLVNYFFPEEIAKILLKFTHGKAHTRSDRDRYIKNLIKNEEIFLAQNPPSLSLTDIGNAKRFVIQHGRDLRWAPDLGNWIYWTGHRWEVDTDGEVMRRAKKTVQNIKKEIRHEFE